jgi:hypothetical protein
MAFAPPSWRAEAVLPASVRAWTEEEPVVVVVVGMMIKKSRRETGAVVQRRTTFRAKCTSKNVVFLCVGKIYLEIRAHDVAERLMLLLYDSYSKEPLLRRKKLYSQRGEK